METIFVQYPTPLASFNKKWPRYDLSILTEENNGHYNDELELHSNQPLVAPQPRKLVCPSPSGPPPQNFFKFDSTDLKDSKARQAEDEIMGIFFRDFDSSSGIEIVSPDSLVSDTSSQTEPSQAFIKRLTSSPCPIPPRDFTTPVPISNSRRPSIASNRLASPFPMCTPPGRVACLPFNSPFVDNNPIGAEFGLLSLSPPAGNKDDVLLQHQRVNAVMNRQRSLSLGDNPRAALLGKA